MAAESGRRSAPSRPMLALGALARRVRELSGWRRRTLAAGLGVVAAATLPPVHLLPLLVVAFTGLVWLIDGSRDRRGAFAAGWWFGFGYFVAGLYWIANALLVEPERYAWMIPLAVFGVGGGLALFPGVAAWLVRLSGAAGAGRVLVLAIAWTGLEWARGVVLTGFPWNLIGSAWAVSDAMIQLAAVAGIYGLSLLTVAVAAMPAALAEPPARHARRGWVALGAALGVLALVWGGGLIRLAGAEAAAVPDVRLRLVQPDIPQKQKWDPELRAQHLVRLLALTRAPGKETVTDVIWPETAAPYFIASHPQLLDALGRAAPEGGLIITGSLRRSGDGVDRRYWNSILAVDSDGTVVAVYDKFHLVPFGEYVPLRGILPIDRITPGRADFSAGPGPRTLGLPGLPPVSPLICYEIIFPREVADPETRPAWILNVTNDGWFGTSSGPYQHFASARLRAVEEGLPVVRAANTGISGIVDPYGRVVARLGLGEGGVVDGALPRVLPPTPFARFGNAIVAALLLGAGVLAMIFSRKS